MDVRDSDEHPFLGREIAQPRRFSEETAHTVDTAVRDLLLEAERRVREVLTGHRAQVSRLIAELKKNETLTRQQIESCLGPAPADKKPAARASSG